MQQGDFDEYIDYVKEKESDKPFKCMKCNHDSKTRAKIARHLFTKHSSAVIIRIKKAVPAKQVKEAGLEAAEGKAVPRRQTRKEVVAIYKHNMAALQEKNQKLEDINQRTGAVL